MVVANGRELLGMLRQTKFLFFFSVAVTFRLTHEGEKNRAEEEHTNI